jgi:MFS family permease
MTLLMLLAGLFLAPALACTFVVVDRHAPAGTVTEAFSWLVTAMGVGSALGAALAGWTAQLHGDRWAFALCGAGGAAGFLVLLLLGGALRSAPAANSGTPHPNWPG